LQRSSALATRQDLQKKEVNGTKLNWVTVAEEFMNGTDSVGLVQENEELSKLNINPEVISKSGTKTTPHQTHDDFKMFVKEYCKVLPNLLHLGRTTREILCTTVLRIRYHFCTCMLHWSLLIIQS
jgi:hypothetical protein